MPLTAGKGAGCGLSGALEQADNTPKLATANQRVQAEVNEGVSWRFLWQFPGWLFEGPGPRH
jgi:hypothetical protein